MTRREILALVLVLAGLALATVAALRIDHDLGLAVAGVLSFWLGLRVGEG